MQMRKKQKKRLSVIADSLKICDHPLLAQYEYRKIRLNKIVARWPAKAIMQFFFMKKSSGNISHFPVLLSYHTKQSNTENPTAYE